jgi:hypothetical protein
MIARGPKVHMQGIEVPTQRLKEDKFIVVGHGAIGGCEAIWASENPVWDVLGGVWPEELEMNLVEGLLDVHAPGSRDSMGCGEYVTPKQSWYNNEHEQFGVILSQMEQEDEFTVKKREDLGKHNYGTQNEGG